MRVQAFGGPEQLTVETVAEAPRLAPGQLLVDVEASGINYLDIYQRYGRYTPPLPYTPGFEGVGIVREVVDGADSIPATLRVGQRVAWIDIVGSYASQLVLPAAHAIPVPDEFTTAQALMFQSLTAQFLVTEYRDVRPGDRILVHSAAGGVGLLLVQWFKHFGAWVVGTTSNDTKAATARSAGADAVINYGQNHAFLDELMSLTGGRGVDLAIDGVGAATLEWTLKGLARGGMAVCIGSASGPPPAIHPDQLVEKGIRLAAGSVFTYTADPAELHRRAGTVIEAIRAGWLH
ncbi:MAG: quinone oxidoreductase family protein, partial [Bryobacteraceae bacterium]